MSKIELPRKLVTKRILGREACTLDALQVLAKPESIEWCNWIADFLEIEADGGDNPGEFVRWCFVEAYKQYRLRSRAGTNEWLENWDGE